MSAQRIRRVRIPTEHFKHTIEQYYPKRWQNSSTQPSLMTELTSLFPHLRESDSYCERGAIEGVALISDNSFEQSQLRHRVDLSHEMENEVSHSGSHKGSKEETGSRMALEIP